MKSDICVYDNVHGLNFDAEPLFHLCPSFVHFFLNQLEYSQMETVIKQAEENRNRSVGIANRVHEEYLPLKHEIDHMRREYLGLNPLPDLHEEEGSTISAEYVFHFFASHSIVSIDCYCKNSFGPFL